MQDNPHIPKYSIGDKVILPNVYETAKEGFITWIKYIPRQGFTYHVVTGTYGIDLTVSTISQNLLEESMSV